MTIAAACETQIPSVPGLDDDQLTVGRQAELNCKADLSGLEFDFAKAVLKTSEQNPYAYKLIVAKAEGGSAFKLNMVFYSAGEHSLDQLILTDGVNEMALSGKTVTVASVLPPPDPAKPQQPYGAVLPMVMSVPPLYYFLLLAGVILLAVAVWRRARKFAYYRDLKNKISSYGSPISPDSQFYKNIRAAEKNDYPLAKLDEAFRLYVLRAYQLPMFDLNNAKILKYFKHTLPAQKEARSALQKILAEFEELQKRQDVEALDRAAFVKKLYRFVEQQRGVGE